MFTNEQIEFIKSCARDLIDDGTNKEYTRGVCELIADIDGVPEVFHDERTQEIMDELLAGR